MSYKAIQLQKGTHDTVVGYDPSGKVIRLPIEHGGEKYDGNKGIQSQDICDIKIIETKEKYHIGEVVKTHDRDSPTAIKKTIAATLTKARKQKHIFAG